MRISDWSSDGCSSDLTQGWLRLPALIPRDSALALDERFDEIAERLRQTGGGPNDPYFTHEVYHSQHRISHDPAMAEDGKRVVWGKSVSVRVDLGGRGVISKNKRYQERTRRRHL